MAEKLQPTGWRSRFDNPAAYLLAVALLLATGGGICAYLIRTKPHPTAEPQKHRGRLVRVFRAEKRSHRVAITAYGTSRASQQWTAIAEVKGRAEEVNPRFEPGEILPAGMLLVHIDPTDYELARDRYRAEADGRQAQIDEIDQNDNNLRAILKLQQRQRDLAKAEYERQHTLYAKRATSLSALEAAESAYETSRTAVQTTQNGLTLLPIQRRLAEASLKAATAYFNQAERDLTRCQVRLPFDARCASKSIEEDQFLAVGERLGTFLALETAEVVAMVETRKMPALFPKAVKQWGILELSEMSHQRALWKQVKIPVKITWALGDQRQFWWGRVARIASSLDPGTRTVPVIVEVPDAYKFEPGVRPPLLPEVLCEVTAYGKTLEGVVVIPRDALRDDRVYLLREGKLHIAPVKVAVREEDLVAVEEGIEPGDLVVLSDLPLVSEGTPLRGKLVNNPVQPRTNVGFPKSLFEEAKEPPTERPATDQPPTDRPATDPPADRPPTTGPAPEATP